MPAAVTSHVSRQIAAPLHLVWQRVEAMELPTIFTPSGPLPGVVRLENQTGSWDAVGRTRDLVLTDGARLREEITQVALPDESGAGFAYNVTGYAGLFGTLTVQAEGRWQLRATGAGTSAEWSYAYVPRNGLTRPVIALINRLFWRRYMEDALRRIEVMIIGGADPAPDTK